MRKFLVVMDDTPEFLNALYFAALRAQNTNAGVVILGIVEPEQSLPWLGVADVMAQEVQEQFEAHFGVFRRWMEERINLEPELIIKHGKYVDMILETLEADHAIGILVLGINSEKPKANPIVDELLGKRGQTLRVPLTLVPGHLSRDDLKTLV